MRRYIEHIKNTRTTHQRRVHALQISGVITATLFAVWLGTLGMRLGGSVVAQDDGTQTTLPAGEQTSLTASAAQAQNSNRAHLEVSTTSVDN